MATLWRQFRLRLCQPIKDPLWYWLVLGIGGFVLGYLVGWINAMGRIAYALAN